ncbi:hypothetical protein BVX97_04855 [bacterium E08(2017)]|nr:hypothetical protein BVX97_04855 [bacterium E08(2017)]
MNKASIKSVLTAFSGALAITSAAELDQPEDVIEDCTKLSDISFVVFDTETTGWGKDTGRVIEIGCVKFINGQAAARKSWLINPGLPITRDSQRVHGISDEMVKDCPLFKEVYPKFTAFTKGSILMAHNASFDIGFIANEVERNELELPNNIVLDTLRLSRKWFPDLKSHSLSKMVIELNIPSGQMHRGLADAECTKEVVLMGFEKMGKEACFKDLTELAGKKYTFKQKRRRKKN